MKSFFLFCLIFIGCFVTSSEAVAAEERLIAVIMTSAQKRHQEINAVFVENSQPFCNENCKIYVQTPNTDVLSLRNSVRKAVALGAELIVTYGSAASLAAKAEAPPMPTLFVDVYDPVSLELVSSKTMSGRNMTGIRGDAPVQALLKYYIEATNAKHLAVLYDLNSPEDNLQKMALEKGGKKRGVMITPLAAKKPEDSTALLMNLPEDTNGIFLSNSWHEEAYLEQILKVASDQQLPVITQRSGAAEVGAFMVMETSAAEQGEKLAIMTGEILGGKKTKDIPMSKPHQVAFVVNLKVAKEYGLHIPFQTLSVASRVVR